MKSVRIWQLMAAMLFVGSLGAAQKGVVKTEFIFAQAPFKQCHASTIAEGKNGLVVAWFGGTREKNPDVSIWLSRQVGGVWTAPTEIDKGMAKDDAGVDTDYATWNPVLFQRPGGELVLFYKIGLNPREWWGAYKTSTDGGLNWSERVTLPKGFAGPIKNKPILLKDGTILCGSSTEDNGWRGHFEATKDLKNWQKIGPINDGKIVAAIQPSILTLGDDLLMALGRSRQKLIWQSLSRDNGKSWTHLRLLDLPNPNAGTDAVTLKNEKHVLVYNHTGRGRSPLNVAVSANGMNWSAAAVLENNPGEYSYPAVIQTKDGLVHITYTWKRESIKHVVLDISKLPTATIMHGAWPN
ncbi:MAG: sialidase [Verrucomicrobiales bacterium]|nr:sialidase [Verrucomicrobiales bacterium]